MKLKLLSVIVIIWLLVGCDVFFKPKFDPYAKDQNGLLTYSYCPISIQSEYRCYELNDKAWLEEEYNNKPASITLDNHGTQINVQLFTGFGYLSNITSIPTSNELVTVGGPRLQIQHQYLNSEKWRTQYYSRFANTFRDIHFVDEKLGFAVGGQSDILRTQDGGKTWQRFNKLSWQSKDINYSEVDKILEKELYDLRFNSQIYSVAFNNKGQGAIVGENGLIYSDNNGQTWQRIMAKLPDFHALQEVTFSDHRNVWAVGYPNLVIHSSNAGKIWSDPIIISDLDTKQNTHLMSIDFADPQHGCMAGNVKINGTYKKTVVFCTDNAGLSWNESNLDQITHDIGNITRLRMRNQLEGWIVSDQGVILKTSDGGLNWLVWLDMGELKHQSPLIMAELWGLTISDDTVYAVGQGLALNDADLKQQLKLMDSFNNSIKTSLLLSWSLDQH